MSLSRSGSQMLRNQLCNLVREFADHQAESMLCSLENDPQQRVWRCDVLPLREQLEAAYLASFEQTAADLARVERFFYPQLKVIVASLLPDYRGNLLEVPAWPSAFAPSIAPLADKVTMDLGTSWWRQWFAVRRAVEERADYLRYLIEDEFLKIADDLVSEARDQFKQRVDYIMHRVDAISAGLRTGIERRNESLARELVLLNGTSDEETLKRFESEQSRRTQDCALKQGAYAVSLAQLGSVLEALDAVESGIRVQ